MLAGQPEAQGAGAAHGEQGAGAAQGAGAEQGVVSTVQGASQRTRLVRTFLTLQVFTFGARQQRAASEVSGATTTIIAATANKLKTLRVILNSPSQLELDSAPRLIQPRGKLVSTA